MVRTSTTISQTNCILDGLRDGHVDDVGQSASVGDAHAALPFKSGQRIGSSQELTKVVVDIARALERRRNVFPTPGTQAPLSEVEESVTREPRLDRVRFDATSTAAITC